MMLFVTFGLWRITANHGGVVWVITRGLRLHLGSTINLMSSEACVEKPLDQLFTTVVGDV